MLVDFNAVDQAQIDYINAQFRVDDLMQRLAHILGSGAADVINRFNRNVAAIGLVILAAALAVMIAAGTGIVI